MTEKKQEVDIMIYEDYHEGKLLYKTEDGKGIVQQNGDRYTVKLYVSESEPWNRLATWLLAEVHEIHAWAMGLGDIIRTPKSIGQLMRDSIYENEKYAENDERQGTSHTDDDLRTYRLLQAWKLSEDGWRIYENDKEYLFLWQGNCKTLEEFASMFMDSSYNPIRFLRAWFDRVLGLKNND